MQKPDPKWDIYYCGDDDANSDNKDAAGAETPDIPISRRPVPPADESGQADEYDNDYASDFGEEETYANAFSRFFLKKNRRNLKLLIVLLLLILLMAALAFVLIITQKLNLIDYNSGEDFGHADQTDVAQEDLVFTPMHDVADASSLRDWLQKWALNGGEKMQSKNVVNCLLCGVDTQEETSGRTDAMILVSVNKKTGCISLVSFMRDSYTYMDINGEDRWYKINSAYNWGGAATLVRTIENNYKIRIDNYITVDFDTFPQLINAIGGIDIEVEKYEAMFIRRTSSHKKFPYGKSVHLNGDQALLYSRIRKCDNDGDVSRTRRQRKVITALISKAQSASLGQLNNMLNTVLPYVRTNYRRAQILSLSTQAIMQDWMKYEIRQLHCPLVTDSEDGTQALTGKDSYIMTGYGSIPEFVWVVDYPADARRIQTALYNMSNINLSEDRSSAFDYLSGGSGTRNTYTQTTTGAYYVPTTNTPEPDVSVPATTPHTRLIEQFTNMFDRDRTDATTFPFAGTTTQPQTPDAPETPAEPTPENDDGVRTE